jgi:hypothetical protein
MNTREIFINPDSSEVRCVAHRGLTPQQVRDRYYPGTTLEPVGQHGMRSGRADQEYCNVWRVSKSPLVHVATLIEDPP